MKKQDNIDIEEILDCGKGFVITDYLEAKDEWESQLPEDKKNRKQMIIDREEFNVLKQDQDQPDLSEGASS
jgi:hypothetical protein